MECFCLDLTATQTTKILRLNRNTVNRFYKLFRESIYQFQTRRRKKFLGEVEVDESYFGAKRIRGWHGKLKRGRGTFKQPVFGIFLRKGEVYTEVIPNCRKPTLQAIIRGRINPESILYSDKWRGYDGLVDVGYDKHYRVNHHKNEFAKKRVHINGIESFWSFTKRRLAKFNGVKVHFDLHLKESEWRFNKTEDHLFSELKCIVNSFLV